MTRPEQHRLKIAEEATAALITGPDSLGGILSLIGDPAAVSTVCRSLALDNGIPAAITELRPEDELPLRVALVIDWSDSIQKDLGFEKGVQPLLETHYREDA